MLRVGVVVKLLQHFAHLDDGWSGRLLRRTTVGIGRAALCDDVLQSCDRLVCAEQHMERNVWELQCCEHRQGIPRAAIEEPLVRAVVSEWDGGQRLGFAQLCMELLYGTRR